MIQYLGNKINITYEENKATKKENQKDSFGRRKWKLGKIIQIVYYSTRSYKSLGSEMAYTSKKPVKEKLLMR